MNVSTVQTVNYTSAAEKSSTDKSSSTSTEFKDLIKNKSGKKTEDSSKTTSVGKKEKTDSSDGDSSKKDSTVSKTGTADVNFSNVCSFIEIPTKNNGTKNNDICSFKQGTILVNSLSGDNAISGGNAISSGNTNNTSVLSNATTNAASQNAENKGNVLVKTSAASNVVKAEAFKGENNSAKGATAGKAELGEVTQEDSIKPVDTKNNNTLLSSSEDKTSLTGDKKLYSEAVTDSEDVLQDKNSGVEISSPLVVNQNEGFITIKVGDPVTSKQWKTVAEKIGNAVVESVRGGKIEKLNITMNPKDLGKIKVEFTTEGDKVSVSLFCSDDNTKSLLSDNIGTLSKIVQSNLGHETSVNVYGEQNNGQQNNGQQKSNENYDRGGNNSHYRDDSQQNGRQREKPDSNFVEKLRLGILDVDSTES